MRETEKETGELRLRLIKEENERLAVVVLFESAILVSLMTSNLVRFGLGNHLFGRVQLQLAHLLRLPSDQTCTFHFMISCHADGSLIHDHLKD